jgi:glycosyltransferase involved in cell wall biosynthesis
VSWGDANGSTISLLHFVRWFKKNGTRRFSVVVAGEGELVSEYEKLVETCVSGRNPWCPGGVRSQVLRAMGGERWARAGERRDLRRFARGCRPGLVYVNSVSAEGARLAELLDLRLPVVTHVHELEFLMRKQAGEALPQVLAGTSRFIACSDAVRENLIRGHDIPPERVHTVHEAIPVANVRTERSQAEILRELHLPEDALLVMGCGTLDWRKGADLFLQLARRVTRERDHVYFAWVGGFPRQVLKFGHDVRLTGLTEKVRFTGPVPKAVDYLAAADVFVLTSRDDPYPLVCLESAALGKPIVCFAGGGGMPEFVEDDCGLMAPYMDVEGMAERVISLLDAPERRARIGEAARRKVAKRHDVSIAGPQIAEIIERTLASRESCAPELHVVAEGQK